MIINDLHASCNWFVQPTRNLLNFEKILVVVDTLNRVTVLANYVGDLGKKYGNYLPVSVSVYASIIIGVMRRVLFFHLLS